MVMLQLFRISALQLLDRLIPPVGSKTYKFLFPNPPGERAGVGK
jgi:hypothetical protein